MFFSPTKQLNHRFVSRVFPTRKHYSYFFSDICIRYAIFLCSSYSLYKIIKDQRYNSNSFSQQTVLVLAIASLLVVLICQFHVLLLYLEHNNFGLVSTSSSNKSYLSFKYETLEKATDYFNPSKKLGQGGAGSVYLGTLPNGKTIAVKRLIYNTRQWVDEFFNEVNLISKIQHKNLVKLLGVSIEGPESLLVYEYVPNKSLDQFLFGNCFIFFTRYSKCTFPFESAFHRIIINSINAYAAK